MKNKFDAGTTAFIFLTLSLFAALSAGCKPGEKSATPEDRATAIFTDSTGRDIAVPETIEKIVPSGTLSQIVLFPLAPDLFIGLSARWPDAAKSYLNTEHYNLPVLGQFYGAGNLNLEEIARINPQLIIDVGESKKSIMEDMQAISEQIRIPAIHVNATIAAMPSAYRTLGKLLHREKEAEVLASYCEEIYGKTAAIIYKTGDKNKIKVLYCSGENGLNVLPRASFHAEILDMMCVNAAVIENPAAKGTGSPVGFEQIALWDPDVIIFAPGSYYVSAGKDPAWKNLRAVRTGKYYEVPDGPYNWMGFPPSVNRYMGMIWLAQLLYPDAAGYDVYEEAARFYRLFYHCGLTEEQYKALVANSLLKEQAGSIR